MYIYIHVHVIWQAWLAIFILMIRLSSKHHTQIRLGLSKLKAHLFTHGIITEPFCPNCPNNSIETPTHLECPAFAALREEMFRGLRELLPPTTINNTTKCVHAIVHGISTASLDQNKNIFSSVQSFILQTHRFIQTNWNLLIRVLSLQHKWYRSGSLARPLLRVIPWLGCGVPRRWWASLMTSRVFELSLLWPASYSIQHVFVLCTSYFTFHTSPRKAPVWPLCCVFILNK